MLKNLGQKIRLMSEKKGISLNPFAKALGISSGYLSQLETGKTKAVTYKKPRASNSWLKFILLSWQNV
ncbi:helix-turn-helix domain-containing protein [Heyndrickxia shackletonii]|uniref:helix-turn-helix domain-containing protein n=1 Tax=Heyndrickxia shackletonii TaxID=157838 RepID=UPI0006EC1658|nr:helix-turn-helix transcriptional regulator [Heyndrickxia shackletonii]NEY98659.1 helix-turn-helix transcriptional regulator [Heyndrickxia shackletonii]